MAGNRSANNRSHRDLEARKTTDSMALTI
jgi:hypothetical protein